jgi:hypothetical protein
VFIGLWIEGEGDSKRGRDGEDEVNEVNEECGCGRGFCSFAL